VAWFSLKQWPWPKAAGLISHATQSRISTALSALTSRPGWSFDPNARSHDRFCDVANWGRCLSIDGVWPLPLVSQIWQPTVGQAFFGGRGGFRSLAKLAFRGRPDLPSTRVVPKRSVSRNEAAAFSLVACGRFRLPCRGTQAQDVAKSRAIAGYIPIEQ
jgi:hypothetical protein